MKKKIHKDKLRYIAHQLRSFDSRYLVNLLHRLKGRTSFSNVYSIGNYFRGWTADENGMCPVKVVEILEAEKMLKEYKEVTKIISRISTPKAKQTN